MGSKSGLAYVDSFNIYSRYEGQLYTYIMLKGEEGNEFSLLDVDSTEDHNGVTILINLKSEDDYEIFLEKMKTQLAYFSGVYIESYYDDIESSYKIIQGEGWRFSELNTDEYLHISLNDVYYPLDFNKLNIPPIKLPIALSFGLNDKITPIPSREGFMYTPVVKEMILNRIKSVGKYFVELWNKKAPSAPDVETAHILHDHFGEVCLYSESENGEEIKNITIKVDKKLENFAGCKMHSVTLELYPGLDSEKLYKNTSYIFRPYRVYGQYSSGKYTTKFGRDGSESLPLTATEVQYYPCYLLKTGESLSKEQIGYIKWRNRECRIVRQHTVTKLGKFNKDHYYPGECYRGLLELDKEPKDTWRDLIKQYQAYATTYTTDKFKSIDDIVPSPEYFQWKEEQKAERKKARYNTKEEITFSTIREVSRRANTKNRWLVDNSTTLTIAALKRLKGLYIYSDDQDESIDEELWNIFRFTTTDQTKRGTRIVMLSDRNYKKLEKIQSFKPLPNWINVKDFWNKKSRFFSNYLTRWFLNQIQSDIKDPDIYGESRLINKKDKAKFDSLITRVGNLSTSFSDNWLTQKVNLYHHNKWLDYNLINEFIIVYKEVHKYDFLKVLNCNYKDTQLVKSIAYTLFIKQCKKDKQLGSPSYKTYDLEKIIKDHLVAINISSTAVEIVDEGDEFDEIDDLEEVSVFNRLPRQYSELQPF